jgi:hypothetical protein
MLMPAVLLTGTVVLIAFLLAMVEIQVMGIHGWAAGLPTTWRIEHHWALDWFAAGRPLTAYHAWLGGFLIAMIHLPMAVLGAWTVKLEARVLGCLLWLWLARDVWWFALNPAYGLSAVTPERATWIKIWFLYLPSDWWLLFILGSALLWWSFRLHVRTKTRPVEIEESLHR